MTFTFPGSLERADLRVRVGLERNSITLTIVSSRSLALEVRKQSASDFAPGGTAHGVGRSGSRHALDPLLRRTLRELGAHRS
jgi:hypothetical protein